MNRGSRLSGNLATGVGRMSPALHLELIADHFEHPHSVMSQGRDDSRSSAGGISTAFILFDGLCFFWSRLDGRKEKKT